MRSDFRILHLIKATQPEDQTTLFRQLTQRPGNTRLQFHLITRCIRRRTHRFLLLHRFRYVELPHLPLLQEIQTTVIHRPIEIRLRRHLKGNTQTLLPDRHEHLLHDILRLRIILHDRLRIAT